MIEINRILCPVDFSEFSRRALDDAVAIANWYRSQITALHVVDVGNPAAGMRPFGGPIVLDPIVVTPGERERLLDDLKRFVGSDCINARMAQGDPVAEIVRVAEEMPADLLVLGTHGRSGFERLLLGSVTEKVLRKASCPVLTVPRLAPEAVRRPVLFRQIVCAVDFSRSSMKALSYALSLAQEADAGLTVLHVLELLPEGELDEGAFFRLGEYRRHLEESALERLKEAVPDAVRPYCRVQELVTVGKAYREILRLAGERGADLIVIGVRGRGAADLMVFGSTTQHVLRQATCPVLTLCTA